MTTAIVLAAGEGSRLAGATTLPKWLVPVGSTCPATEQLAGLEALGIRDVRVVVGEANAEIKQHVARLKERMEIELLPNDHSTTRNNWYSLVIGLRSAVGSGDDDLLVLNSDLFADRAWFERSVVKVRATGHAAALGIDPTKGQTDEAMKVVLDPTGTKVTEIGKAGIDRAGGEYVGLAYWNQRAGAELLATLERFFDQPDDVNNWYEHGIQAHIDSGRVYGMAPVASPDWVEIDDPTDLDAAVELAAGLMP